MNKKKLTKQQKFEMMGKRPTPTCNVIFEGKMCVYRGFSTAELLQHQRNHWLAIEKKTNSVTRYYEVKDPHENYEFLSECISLSVNDVEMSDSNKLSASTSKSTVYCVPQKHGAATSKFILQTSSDANETKAAVKCFDSNNISLVTTNPIPQTAFGLNTPSISLATFGGNSRVVSVSTPVTIPGNFSLSVIEASCYIPCRVK